MTPKFQALLSIGENTVIGAGAIITKNIPAKNVAFGVNQYKPKNPDYDFLFNPNMIPSDEIVKVDEEHVATSDKTRKFQSIYRNIWFRCANDPYNTSVGIQFHLENKNA